MKIDVFLKLYYAKKTAEERVNLVKDRIKNRYVPLEEKQTYAQNIIKASFYERESDETEKFRANSVAKYMLTCMTLVELYTDLEKYDGDGGILHAFNALNQAGIFDILVKEIDQRELKEFNMILQMVYDDIMTNEYEPGGFVRNQVERFGSLIGTALLPFLNNLDMSKVEEIVKGVAGEINKK